MPSNHLRRGDARFGQAILFDQRAQSRREIVGVREQPVLQKPADPARIVVARLSRRPSDSEPAVMTEAYRSASASRLFGDSPSKSAAMWESSSLGDSSISCSTARVMPK